MWFVVQVRTGTEESVRKQCEKMLDKCVIERCFIPYYEKMKRFEGAWHKETRILFPGYIFAIGENADGIFHALKQVIGLTRLLGAGDTVIPLQEEEIRFLLRFGGENQVVEMSKGLITGDSIHILEGPLKGCEGLITRIDRHKKRAWLKFQMFGRLQEVEVGLEVLRNTDGLPDSSTEDTKKNKRCAFERQKEFCENESV